MKKSLLICVLAMVLTLLLAGCGCKHEWMAATCSAPKTCQLCNKTEGEALPHTWQDATCSAPKTCTVCKATEGTALAHTWQDATCTVAKTCSVCAVTEGEALGHTWQDATCDAPKTCTVCAVTEGEKLEHDWQEATTEAPKTCGLCGLTEGEKLVTDPRFTTAATKHLHGTWTTEINMTKDMMGLEYGFENGFDCIVSITFGNTGEAVLMLTLKDEATFLADYKACIIEMTYAEFQAQGYDKEAADQAMLETYGMSMEAYVDASLSSINVSELFDLFTSTEYYYVQDDKIYMDVSWEIEEFESSAYTLQDGVLTIDILTMDDGGEPTKWTKAAE